ncbi:MAG: hypothetical protein Q4C60_00925 [Eubacteriales bacterium]|nr:hypothetical protein [Eubacteriales bacterium]
MDTSTVVSLLDGLENAGFELNDSLSELYTEYRADRPVVSINDGQEWTLPEVPAAQYSVAETVVYGEENPRSSDETAAVNRLDFARGEVTYLSRADGFANYEEATAAPLDYEVKETVEAHGTYDPAAHDNPDDEMPATGARNGLTLADLLGAADCPDVECGAGLCGGRRHQQGTGGLRF